MGLPVPLAPGGCCSVVSVGEAGQVRPGQGTSYQLQVLRWRQRQKRGLDQEKEISVKSTSHLGWRGGMRAPRNRSHQTRQTFGDQSSWPHSACTSRATPIWPAVIGGCLLSNMQGSAFPTSLSFLNGARRPRRHKGQSKAGRIQRGWRGQQNELLSNTLLPHEHHDRNGDKLEIAPARALESQVPWGTVLNWQAGGGGGTFRLLWGLEPITILIAELAGGQKQRGPMISHTTLVWADSVPHQSM